MRNTLLAGLAGLFMSIGASAADPFLEGKDYSLLETPVKTANPNKIEVVEVFSYTCPHCYHFQPLVEAWMKTQKADVQLVQEHTAWSSAMETYQRGYYTMQLMGVKDKLHDTVFDYLHKDQKTLEGAQDWASFLATKGLDKNKVLSTFDSFIVTGEIAKAMDRIKAYRVSGTPEIIVDGKYKVSTRMSGSQEDMLKVTAFLVEKSRAEHAAKK